MKPEPILDSETGGKIAGWAWDRRDQIAQSLAQLYAWFGRRKPRSEEDISPTDEEANDYDGSILIIGSGGVGKTTLASFLGGEFDLINSPPSRYTESNDTESFILTDRNSDEGISLRLVVPPGQEHRRPAHWEGLYSQISGGEYRGIIFLNSYGYHNIGRLRFKEHIIFPQAKGKNKFLAAFLADRRAEEIRVLKLLQPYISANNKKIWLLSLTVKQDLWWSREGLVNSHYRQGEWATVINELLTKHGTSKIRHEYHSASLVISNFCTGMDELLQKNEAGYDHSLYVDGLRRLIEIMDSLRQWECSHG